MIRDHTPAVTKRPSVSVVIPCFAQAHVLANAIRSALAQTYSGVEIVVVNDGSPDDTTDVARSTSPDVIVVEQPNAGLAAARNAGIERATGDFIVFLDADDELSPDAVDFRMRIMASDHGIGIVVGYHVEMDSSGVLLDRTPERRSVPADAFYEVVARSFPPVGWMVRREVFTLCGNFDTSLETCEDWDFLVRVAAAWRVGYDAASTQRYRVWDGSLSTRFDRQFEWSRRMLAKNAHLAPNRARFEFARWQAGFYHVRYLLGRMRLLPTRRERVSAFAQTSRRQPKFFFFAVLVAATYPFWRRHVGL